MVRAESYFRGKSRDSFMLKLLTKPEANAEEAAKDGIGLKFEVSSIDDVKKLVPFLSRHFKENLGAKEFIFDNTKLFERNDIEEVSNEIKAALSEDVLIKKNDNPHTNESFQALKITGDIPIPRGGEESGMRMERQFEIQIVLINNKNESGFSNHHVYEASKKLAVATRLWGSITEDYLDIISREASENSGIKSEAIKDYFKDTFLAKLIVGGKGRKKKRYAHEKTMRRTSNAAMVPESVNIREKDDQSSIF